MTDKQMNELSIQLTAQIAAERDAYRKAIEDILDHVPVDRCACMVPPRPCVWCRARKALAGGKA